MTDLTKIFSNFVSQATLQNFNDEMIFFSKMSMIDWCGVAYAAKEEPVAKIVTKLIDEEQTKGLSRLISNGKEVSAKSAAFVNGTVGHALDYDDTHFLFTGHPTASAFPTALALGEELGSSIYEIMLAYMCGVEISTRLGHILGYSHYNKGFHQTATSGAFGATLVASKLLKLDAKQIENALGIVSTRASGLKSQFGTMGKPFHAGIAASNGIEAAKLSKLGFVSCENGIECNQGFLKTHAWNESLPEAAINNLGKDFLFPEIKYKFHACCHGLHAFLEALDELKTKNNFNPDSIEKISIQTQPSWLQVCNINSPKPMINIHGDSDFIVPYDGTFGLKSINEVIDYWVTLNNSQNLSINESFDKTIKKYQYSDINGSVYVEHYKIISGGHTWNDNCLLYTSPSTRDRTRSRMPSSA